MDALKEIRQIYEEITAQENIADDAVTLDAYARDASLVQGCRPLLVVFPQSKVEIIQIVNVSNELCIPLIPVSSGSPHFNGGTVPNQSGIIVDMSRMNRILKIDAVNRCVMIEPGVTFKQILPQVKKHGLKLNMPLLPRGNKSVLTACLEREPPLIPKYQFDNVDPLLTLEVIYGTGVEFRTGSASGPGDLNHLTSDKVNPWGPGSVDFHRFISGAQGTMGVATWGVIKTEVLPSIQKLFVIPSSDYRKAAALMGELSRQRVADECLSLNHVDLAAILSKNLHMDYEQLRDNLPPWTTIVCLAGYQRRPDERLAIQKKYLLEICESFGLKPDVHLLRAGGIESNLLELLSECWAEEPYWKLRVRGACQSIFFLTPLSKVAEYLLLMDDLVSKYPHNVRNIGCYIQPIVQGRGYHCEFNLFYNENDAQEAASVRQLFDEASLAFMKHGAYFSRPYAQWAKMVYGQYPEGVDALRKLKHIFDPNNILNPGKLCF